MLLRHKVGLISLVYAISLVVILSTAAWCISVYFHSAFRDYTVIDQLLQDVESLRRSVRAVRPGVESGEVSLERAVAPLHREFLDISDRAESWASGAHRTPEWEQVEWLASDVRPVVPGELDVFERRLSDLAHALNSSRQARVRQAASTQARVVVILLLCGFVGATLCVTGVFFIRRWVVQPVAKLREATREIASGNYAYRVRTASRDELGHLADEINRMCATIVEMQQRLIEREKLETTGEMMRFMAHNIRNPLAGLRALAEETAARHAGDPQTAECQRRIISSVDQLESWFRHLQHAMTPVALSVERTNIRALVAGVVEALGPLLGQRGTAVNVVCDGGPTWVRCDAMQIEQALVALLTNAAQASSAGQTIRIQVLCHPEREGDWILAVEDQGEGIAQENLGRVFKPNFTTKPQGSGLGLAMVSNIINSHSGRVTVESVSGGGARFAATLPGRLSEGD